MRVSSIVCLLALTIIACGPSGREIALAKQTRYRGDKLALFATVKSVTESKHKLHSSDETTLTVRTLPRWFSPEGQAVASSGPEDYQHMPDRSLNVALVVELVADGDAYVVVVRPKLMRYLQGRPNADPLAADDPSLPGWVSGRVDQLQVAIYEALKSYEVKTPGGVAPTSSAPGATTP